MVLGARGVAGCETNLWLQPIMLKGTFSHALFGRLPSTGESRGDG